MAVTISNLDFSVAGDKRRTIGTVTFDNSYNTGGETITPQQIGLGTILFMDVSAPVSATPTTRMCSFNNATNAFVVFTSSDGNQVAGGVDLSTFSAQFEAIGW